MALSAQLQAHLDSGTTTLCRCWVLTRKDGLVLGFTDHDQDLEFSGTVFKAESGLTAQALQQTTGLSVDNGEALGALSAAAVSEADLLAGRYDGAEVEAWLVNWVDPSQRALRFRGAIGEIQAGGGAFRAELRGLSELLNQARGRAYQQFCPAQLGDSACQVNLNDPAFYADVVVVQMRSPKEFEVTGLAGFADGWFDRGRLLVTSGPAQGLEGTIKRDLRGTGKSEIVLWEDLRAALSPGDSLRLEAGCDKRMETCRTKFSNLLNFRGFPHIPGEDWMVAYPTRNGRNNGGSRTR